MEDLNKNQFILLVILISFVTSIATGVVTVSLMQEAPPVVTQTVNRIVERTIEKVVPGETKIQTVVRETPVLVTEEEMIVEIVKAASGGVVRVSRGEDTNLGSGFLISKEGLILSAAHLFDFEGAGEASYKITFYNGKTAKGRLVKKGDSGIAVLKLDLGLANDLSKVPELQDKEKPLSILSLNDGEVFPGQTVIALGLTPAGTVGVSRGIISGFGPTGTSTSGVIETAAAQTANSGGPLLNLKSRVTGLISKEGTAINTQTVRDLLAK